MVYDAKRSHSAVVCERKEKKETKRHSGKPRVSTFEISELFRRAPRRRGNFKVKRTEYPSKGNTGKSKKTQDLEI